jgi:flagellar biosynthesis protein FlhA
MGFVMPAVRILDNVQLDANAYVIKIKEVEAGGGKVWTGQYMEAVAGAAVVSVMPCQLPGPRHQGRCQGRAALWVVTRMPRQYLPILWLAGG